MDARRRLRIAAAALATIAWLGACDDASEEAATPAPPVEAPAPSAPEPPLPNVLWVTIDTLRPDHLTPYGYVRDTSPGLGRLAREGVRFDAVTAQAPWTFGSVPSLLTSSHPRANRDLFVDGVPQALVGPGSESVASALSAAGYRTVLVAGHGALSTIDRLCEGFDECLVEPGRAEEVTTRALDAARSSDERPLFLWAYYIDPHVPYEAPAELVEAFARDGRVRTGITADRGERRFVGFEHIPAAAWVEGHRDLDWYVAAYDAEIRYTDQHVERLVRGLEASRSGWLTMVFADHGESLTEHGLYLSHTVRLDDTILRIPWILRWRGHVPEGHAIGAEVMALDLAPTLLGLIERPTPASWRGRDLSGCVRGTEACASRPAFALYNAGEDARIAMRSGADKVVCDLGGSTCELYRLRADPAERDDRCAARPDRCAELRDRALAWYRSQPAPAFGPERVRRLDEATLGVLRSLGYLR